MLIDGIGEDVSCFGLVEFTSRVTLLVPSAYCLTLKSSPRMTVSPKSYFPWIASSSESCVVNDCSSAIWLPAASKTRTPLIRCPLVHPSDQLSICTRPFERLVHLRDDDRSDDASAGDRRQEHDEQDEQQQHAADDERPPTAAAMLGRGLTGRGFCRRRVCRARPLRQSRESACAAGAGSEAGSVGSGPGGELALPWLFRRLGMSRSAQARQQTRHA